MKKIIINADDFGYSVNKNEAVKFGFQSGIITSASMITNMEGFGQAIEEVLPEIPFMDLGFHFNIFEGKSLTNPSLLTDRNGYFNRSWFEIMLDCGGEKMQRQLETEFRMQLERILVYKHISHIDSHMHVHALPPIFNLVSRLAKEYKIPFVRTSYEIPYKVFYLHRPFINKVKNIVLNTFTLINKCSDNEILTTDYFIGVLYTGRMTKETILKGLEKINNDNSITEIIIHPSIEINAKNKKKKEFEILTDVKFRKELENLDFTLTSFSCL